MLLYRHILRNRRRIAVLLIVVMLFNSIHPSTSFALTSGPSQPEFSSFEPVVTTSMVNEFTGDFTYNLPVLNIPGSNGDGYALSLSYHSGTTPEEESSWVGYGFTLNPGAITREKRGFPDDWNGKEITYWNRAPKNETVAVGTGLGAEIFSIGLKGSGSIRYNNFKGFGYSTGLAISAGGVVSLGYNVTDNEGSFSLSINPAGILDYLKEEGSKNDSKSESGKKAERNKTIDQLKRLHKRSSISIAGSRYGLLSYAGIDRPTQVSPYSGKSFSLALGVLGAPAPIPIGISGDLFGSYTYQENMPEDNLKAYGYLYSALAGNEDMMDYSVENNSFYNKRDKFLSIPFNSADNFMATGEGISGGFRAYNKRAGHFHPNKKKSETLFFSAGLELTVGTDLGGGGDLGGGNQTLEVSSWKDLTAFADPEDSLEDEANILRFNNDLGGFVRYGSESLQSAGLRGGGAPGLKAYEPEVEVIGNELNEGNRSGRSSYIGYSLNEQMTKVIGGVPYRAYEKSLAQTNFIDRDEPAIADQLGEISILNEDGQRYTYGLPVYSRNEKNLQVGVQGAAANQVHQNYLVYKDITDPNLSVKVGEERDDPYATTYLLTSIVDADYIDRTHNGATQDDFGDYTRFAYRQVYGSRQKSGGSNWYAWRMPYNGLHYYRNELSNPKDDLGSVIQGEKEIYYLDSIRTKTHVAVFECSDRNDGLSAEANMQRASSDANSRGTQRLQKLDRIKLYAIDGNSLRLIRTVNFAYDYSVMAGVPNASAGRLTLKRVWFEHQGIVSATISPYQFDYQYPATNYPSKYDAFENYGAGREENPDYSPFSIDAWGNYQADGGARFSNLKSWVNQTPTASFDPAAWQLKVIKLPSGGEIHVQYEQDDYYHVQDKIAHAMVSLEDNPGNQNENRFYVNLADVGITDPQDKQRLRQTIQKIYVDNKERMYFKYLYKLIGSDIPQLSDCNAEYITGYVQVRSVGIDTSGKLWVELGSGQNNYDIPREVCEDLVKTQKLGMLTLTGDCNASQSGIQGSSPTSIIQNFLAFVATFSPAEVTCLKMNNSLSYLRIPVVHHKKGGGLRVKRLLMYDAGTVSGYPELYGNEYIYQKYDDQQGAYISTGVATNEPVTIREENVLVGFLKRFEQGFLDKIISGRDKKQSEGPIGETILPAPSVGYAEVIVKNIHEGKTSPGFSVYEFHTAKDFPVTHELTPIKTEKDYLPIYGGLINKFTNNLWASQGFVFNVNNMHGQMRSFKTYAGNYDPVDVQHATLIASVNHTYFEPGESLPVMKGWDKIEYQPLGREMDLTFESKAVKDNSNDLTVEIDGSVGIFGIILIPYVSAFPYLNFSEAELHSHVTTKVIQHPAVMKKSVSFQDGIYHVTENVAFNQETGKPIITKMQDDFYEHSLNNDLASSEDGEHIYTNYVVPASSRYKNLGQVAEGEKRFIKSGQNGIIIQKTIDNNSHSLKIEVLDTITQGACNICCVLNSFKAGDLVKLQDNAGYNELFHVDGIRGTTLKLEEVSYQGPYSGYQGKVDVEIIRSGKTNQLNNQTGSITTYGPDISKTLHEKYVNEEFKKRQELAQVLTDSLRLGKGTIDLRAMFPELWISITNADCDGPKGQTIILDFETGVEGKVTLKEEGNRSKETLLPKSDPVGKFLINSSTGQLEYQLGGESCENITFDVESVRFCRESYVRYAIDNVVESNAATFGDRWPYTPGFYYPISSDTLNNFENGQRGKWRLASEFAYVSEISGLNSLSSTAKNFNSGLFELELFDWNRTSNNDREKWRKFNTVTKYSPHGQPLEEENILGIKSTAKFGYHSTLPYLVAENSPYEYVAFESFENTYTSGSAQYFEDGLFFNTSVASVVDDTSHAGDKSLRVRSGNTGVYFGTLPIYAGPTDLSLKLWAKTSGAEDIQDHLVMEIREHNSTAVISRNFRTISQVGEWTLLEAQIHDLVGLQDIFMTYNFQNENDMLWIDDMRLQPMDAQVTTYVYDATSMKLLTSFDDQHFGLFHQYNAEGKLIRKIIETEKGMKTVRETQYNTVQVPR